MPVILISSIKQCLSRDNWTTHNILKESLRRKGLYKSSIPVQKGKLQHPLQMAVHPLEEEPTIAQGRQFQCYTALNLRHSSADLIYMMVFHINSKRSESNIWAAQDQAVRDIPGKAPLDPSGVSQNYICHNNIYRTVQLAKLGLAYPELLYIQWKDPIFYQCIALGKNFCQS